MGKEATCHAGDPGDTGSIPGSGRSPGEGNGNPVQYSCLKIPWTEDSGRLQSKGLQRVQHNGGTEYACTQPSIDPDTDFKYFLDYHSKMLT